MLHLNQQDDNMVLLNVNMLNVNIKEMSICYTLIKEMSICYTLITRCQYTRCQYQWDVNMIHIKQIYVIILKPNQREGYVLNLISLSKHHADVFLSSC